MGAISRLLLALTVAAGPFAAMAGPYKAPRDAFGRPDLQGVWTNESMTHLERPKDFTALVATPAEAAAYEKRRGDRYQKEISPDDPRSGAPPPVQDVGQDGELWYGPPLGLARIGGQIRTSWLVDPADGKLPLTEAARAAEKAGEFNDDHVFDNPEARPVDERCVMGPWLPAGPPLTNPGDNALLQIVQTRDHLLIEAEMNHDARIVPIGAAPRLPGALRPWMGDSLGRWEGDTLVVETMGFNPGDSWQVGKAYVRMSPGARVVERFSRVGPDALLYRFEASDPAFFTQPWRGEMILTRTKERLFEFACHEGNYSLVNALAGARKSERDGTAATTAATASGAPAPGRPAAP